MPNGIGQGTFESNRDSIFNNIYKYQSQDSFAKYYENVKALEKLYFTNDYSDSLYLTGNLYDLLPCTKADSFEYRKACTYRANYIEKLNDYTESLQWYLLSHKYCVDTKKDKWVWYIESKIGNIYARQNDYEKAIYYLKLCIPSLLESKNYGNLCRLYRDIGNNYYWLDDPDKMIDAFNKGIAYANLEKNPNIEIYKGLYAIHQAYGNYYLETNSSEELFHTHIDLAKEYLDRLNSLKEYKNNPINNVDYYGRKSDIIELEGDMFKFKKEYQSAINYYNKCIDLGDQIYKNDKSRELAKIYNKRAFTYLALDELRMANDNYKIGINKLLPRFKINELPSKQLIKNENTFTELLDFKAEYYHNFYLKSNEISYLDSALLAIDLAIYANQQLDEQLLLENSKYVSIGYNKKLILKGIEYSYEALEKTNDKKYNSLARTYFDKSKSLLLNKNQSLNSIFDLMDEKEKEIYKKHKQALIKLSNISKTPDNLDSIENEIVKHSSVLIKMEKKHSNELNSFEYINSPYIEYVTGENQLYIYTNIGNLPFIRIANKNDIEKLIAEINSKIKLKQSNQLNDLLSVLYKKLIPLALKDISNITIIPDGLLSLLPFDILIHNEKYLYETHVISYAYSRLRLKNEAPKFKDLTLFYLQPKYPMPEVPIYASVERGSLTFLPNAQKEIEGIKSIMQSNYEIATNLNIYQLADHLTKSDIFHYTGHAIVEKDSAYLALIGDDGSHSKLNTKTISQMNNQLKMVTLSACETGLGEFKQGEGVISMASSFMNSGALAVVYSLWNANDQSTTEIMTNFYKNIKKGENKDLALNNAKKQFLATCAPEQRHPYYWAAFVIAGDTSSIFDNDPIPYQYYLYVLMGLIILIAFYQFKTKRL
jgi:CHAT domain-containing protein